MKQKLQLQICCIMLAWSFNVPSHAQEIASSKNIALEVNAAQRNQVKSLQGVLKEFEVKHNISIAYKSELIGNKKVDVEYKSYGSLEKDLDALLKQHDLYLKKVRNSFYVVEKGRLPDTKKSGLGFGTNQRSAAEQQLAEVATITVKGLVTSLEDGQTIPGANILIKGTATGTVTDINGTYTLDAPEEGTLVFSSIGYITQEVAVNGRAVIDIILMEDMQSLDEVVVVGYGTQKKSDITGSVVSLDNKRLENLPNANVLQAMQGAVPGLSVTMNSNDADQSNQEFYIRGPNSITASNQPLIIVDGIPYSGNISDINPNDIASVDVLKDASSSAI
jgi:hypothetical protein